jgi:regulatory protein
MAEDPRERARQKAYRLLAFRAHSEMELSAKLREGGFTESVIAGVLEKCRELGYLDDGKYARQRARELAVNRLLGDRRIAFDLRGKGISETLSREAIAAARKEISAAEAIERLLKKKLPATADAAGMDQRQREGCIRSLMGKGFSTGLIFSKLKRTEEDGFHDDDGE